jgi:hypothetical protein
MLRETQERFAATLLSPAPPAADMLGGFASGGVAATDRIGVYRDNMRAGLAAALYEAFPAVRLLVGHEFMRMIVARYIDAHPPCCADVNMYGDAFPAFIAAFAPAAELAYLADVAALEWLAHRAAFAADAPALDPQSLTTLPPGVQADIMLSLRPGVAFIASPWPLCAIRDFALAQHEDSALDVNGGGGTWMVARPALDVVIDALPPAHRDFFTACDGHTPLHAATAQTAAQHTGFDLAAALTRGFRYAIFTAPPASL